MAEMVTQKPHDLIDPQAHKLVEFLRDIGLPYENIIANQESRKAIGENLQSIIEGLPAEVKKDARYLSKFVIGAGFGLFDYSLNAIWNEVVLNLRRKAVLYGLEIFFDSAVGGSNAREHYKSESDLSSLKDSVLLDTCRKLELIRDTTYKKLKHILDMRNDVGISHPTEYNINAYELLGWLQTCASEVLNDNPTAAALQVKAFIENLKSQTDTLDNGTIKAIETNLSELPTHLCGSLLRTIFGIYVTEDSEPSVRKNISLIAPQLWDKCHDEVKFKLGIVLQGYNVNLYKEKYQLGEQFFAFVGGNSFRTESERVIIVDDLVTQLRDTHNGWDNFHHEPPVASQLYTYNVDQAAIVEGLASRIFKTVLLCRIGNGVSYNGGVSPGAKGYYDTILSVAGDKYTPHVLASFGDFEIYNRLANGNCLKHAIASLETVKNSVINARLIECLEFLVQKLPGDPRAAISEQFKKLSSDYIKW